MFTSSGVHVRFLRVYDKSGYQTNRWVRYITRWAPPLYEYAVFHSHMPLSMLLSVHHSGLLPLMSFTLTSSCRAGSYQIRI
jgi:hypothetical protein